MLNISVFLNLSATVKASLTYEDLYFEPIIGCDVILGILLYLF